jgi:hypothetical protein
MLSFAITDLRLNETTFQIPSSLDQWVFNQAPNYQKILIDLDRGKYGNTYHASNCAVTHLTPEKRRRIQQELAARSARQSDSRRR